MAKNTINDLTAKQELPVTAKNLIITTARTSCISSLPKIHKPNNPDRPIASACSCPTVLISSYYRLTLRTANTHLKFFVTLIPSAKTNLFSLWI